MQTLQFTLDEKAWCIRFFYRARIGRKPAPMLDDYRQVLAETDTFVLTDNLEVVGVLVMRQEQAEMLLINVAVSPRCKGKGFGKKLMAFCERHALDTGCEAVRRPADARQSSLRL
ncbi:GNAT family N-acetyltransferase [Pseudomonas laurylsulfatiphila]|uniref:GNAT family N-acetyltransferase n=1 Tax=Pseudomonas laurylsulfatiphila TaxID=2011015 RepID=UPI003D1C2741